LTGLPILIMAEASLSFLGFGIPPPTPSWGGMLSGSGRQYMFLAPWMVIWPGLALSTVVYGINMFGDAVEGRHRALWGESEERSHRPSVVQHDGYYQLYYR
jgi:ABC-type dipeptide/oligopeptide/nickel transport system permease subunit